MAKTTLADGDILTAAYYNETVGTANLDNGAVTPVKIGSGVWKIVEETTLGSDNANFDCSTTLNGNSDKGYLIYIEGKVSAGAQINLRVNGAAVTAASRQQLHANGATVAAGRVSDAMVAGAQVADAPFNIRIEIPFAETTALARAAFGNDIRDINGSPQIDVIGVGITNPGIATNITSLGISAASGVLRSGTRMLLFKRG